MIEILNLRYKLSSLLTLIHINYLIHQFSILMKQYFAQQLPNLMKQHFVQQLHDLMKELFAQQLLNMMKQHFAYEFPNHIFSTKAKGVARLQAKRKPKNHITYSWECKKM